MEGGIENCKICLKAIKNNLKPVLITFKICSLRVFCAEISSLIKKRKQDLI